MSNEFKEYSIQVKSKALESYLKGFKFFSERFLNQNDTNIADDIENAFKPLLLKYEQKIEDLEKDIENLKRQIK